MLSAFCFEKWNQVQFELSSEAFDAMQLVSLVPVCSWHAKNTIYA